MIDPTYCVMMARYNLWMNEKMYAAAATLANEQRTRNMGAFFGSLHGTLNHLIVADTAWLSRFTPESILPVPIARITALDQIVFDDFSALRTARVELDVHTLTWAQRLTADALSQPLRYRRMNGAEAEVNMRDAIVHFFNHQTHHRGQASTLLTQLGADIGVTDFIMMPGLVRSV